MVSLLMKIGFLELRRYQKHANDFMLQLYFINGRRLCWKALCARQILRVFLGYIRLRLKGRYFTTI